MSWASDPSDEDTAAKLKTALDAIARGDVKLALGLLPDLAEAGHAKAQTALGLLYARGRGVEQNFHASVELFRQAAEQGDAEGQHHLGYCYLTGAGVDMDRLEAVAWFLLAAARDHPAARQEVERWKPVLPSGGWYEALGKAARSKPSFPAGWSADPRSGTKVWLPSGFRQGTYGLRVEAPAVDGFAEGKGEIVLTGSFLGEDNQHLDARFHRGYLFDDEILTQPFEALESNSYLVRLPDSESKAYEGVAFWVHNHFDTSCKIRLCSGSRFWLLAVVPEAFPMLDDDAVRGVIRETGKIYFDTCERRTLNSVEVVPRGFRRILSYGDMHFEPRLAEANVDTRLGSELFQLFMYTNFVADEHRRQLREDEKQRELDARRRKTQDILARRGNLDVLGFRLGMAYEEARPLFEDEVAAADPPWPTKENLPPYVAMTRSIRLGDGATIEVGFSSPVNGSVLQSCHYQRYFQDRPSVAALLDDLHARFGPPDHSEDRSGLSHMGYVLPSSLEGSIEAGMGISYEVDHETGEVSYLHILVVDPEFRDHDLRSAAAVEREAKRREARRRAIAANRSRKAGA